MSASKKITSPSLPQMNPQPVAGKTPKSPGPGSRPLKSSIDSTSPAEEEEPPIEVTVVEEQEEEAPPVEPVEPEPPRERTAEEQVLDGMRELIFHTQEKIREMIGRTPMPGTKLQWEADLPMMDPDDVLIVYDARIVTKTGDEIVRVVGKNTLPRGLAQDLLVTSSEKLEALVYMAIDQPLTSKFTKHLNSLVKEDFAPDLPSPAQIFNNDRDSSKPRALSSGSGNVARPPRA